MPRNRTNTASLEIQAKCSFSFVVPCVTSLGPHMVSLRFRGNALGLVLPMRRTGGRHLRAKYKQQESAKMPKWALDFRLLDAVRQFGGPWVENDESLAPRQRGCLVCEMAAHLDSAADLDAERRDLWVCCHCFLAWHRTCAEHSPCVSERAASTPGVGQADVDEQAEGSYSCPFCRPCGV